MEKKLSLRSPLSNTKDGAMLRFLYRTVPGRAVLRVLTAPSLSRACGAFLDSSPSRVLIQKFVNGNNIQLSDYEKQDYSCFNDCFCRKIRTELRPIDASPDVLISPCDGLLSAYAITDGSIIPAKQSRYTIAQLLDNDEAAARFDGGICLVFRLCVNHYHRYCFPDDGEQLRQRFVKGVLHTVRPIALEGEPVFIQNSREYSILKTVNFGTLAQIEVGAMLVGKIKNHPINAPFARGQEKGMFLYGGSTVILLIEKDAAQIEPELFDVTANGYEVPVWMGEPIARKHKVQ